jgi:hypothetical protein
MKWQAWRISLADYEIAIPSFKRPETIKKKTLRVLEEYNIDPSKITIFVANSDEYEDYSKSVGNKYKIVIGVPTIGAQRNYIEKYYPEGTHLMMFDDDIEEVQKKISEQKLGRVEDLEKEVILKGFEECIKNNAKTFGIYAAANAYFMKDRVYTKLCYVIASMFGVIVEHSDDLARVTNHGEDYEYSIRQYIKNGAVVRLDNYTVKSNYYKEDGGLQTIRTKEYVKAQIEIIANMFPELCTMYIRETTGHAELRLRDTRKPVGNSIESFFG